MTEQELRDAIALACETDYERAMAAPKHRFSRKFRKEMKTLLQPETGKHTLPALYPVHGRRRMVIVVAVLVLLLGTTVMGRGFFQSMLGKHILTGYTDHVQLNLPEADVDENDLEQVTAEGETETEEDFEFVCKKPQWVPEGYKLESEEYEEIQGEYAVCYINEYGKNIWYCQIDTDIDANIGLSSEGETLQEFHINEYNGYLVLDNSGDNECWNAIWIDKEYTYTVSGDLGQTELLEIIESIK